MQAASRSHALVNPEPTLTASWTQNSLACVNDPPRANLPILSFITDPQSQFERGANDAMPTAGAVTENESQIPSASDIVADSFVDPQALTMVPADSGIDQRQTAQYSGSNILSTGSTLSMAQGNVNNVNFAVHLPPSGVTFSETSSSHSPPLQSPLPVSWIFTIAQTATVASRDMDSDDYFLNTNPPSVTGLPLSDNQPPPISVTEVQAAGAAQGDMPLRQGIVGRDSIRSMILGRGTFELDIVSSDLYS